MTASALQPDVCVIGASEAGRAVAMGAAAMGCSVVVLDDGDPSGFANRELTLELLRAEARRPDAEPKTSWARVQDGLRRAAVERSHARLAAMNIRVIAATGRFRDPDTVDADGAVVRARRFVIATGRAQGEGKAGPDRASLGTLARLPARPDRLDLLGSDPEAISAAQSLARLGVVVSLSASGLLPEVDPELAAPLLVRLRLDGITILDRDAAASGTALRIGGGRVPALDALALDRANIARTGVGLTLTPGLRTTNPRVFAVGSPAGARSTAAGLAQAGVVLRAALLRLPARDRPGLVPVVVPTDPEIAQLGLTEEAARERGPVHVWRWPLGQSGPGFVAGGAPGHLKVVTDRRGRVLGAGIVGPQARELIGFWTLALSRRLSLGEIAEVPVPLPSWSESVRGVTLSHAAWRLSNPWVRRALDLMRRFG